MHLLKCQTNESHSHSCLETSNSTELSQLSGVAAILRFPMDDPEGEEEEDNHEEEEEDDDDDVKNDKICNEGENGYSDDEVLTKWSSN